jgi:hypothetical protein
MSKRYVYQCSLATCKKKQVSEIELSDHPWCAAGGTHHKKMELVESESTGIPAHMTKRK